MCIHEILGKGGFNECFFLTRHFKQECVSGSLVGWIAPQENTIDNLIEFNADNSFEQTNGDSLSEEVLEGSSDGTSCIQKNLMVVLAGHIPPTGVDMKPFSRKYVENVAHNVVTGYNTYSESRQYEVSMLVPQLQELMTTDDSGSNILDTQDILG